MLSYPTLLRWVKTPIEKKVLLVSMSIHSTYMHTPIYTHEIVAVDAVDTANSTRISQRVHVRDKECPNNMVQYIR